MRESIFEKYKKEKVNYKSECEKIRDLVNQHTFSFNTIFSESKVNYFGVNFMDALSSITKFDFGSVPSYSNGFEDPINDNEITFTMFLDILEFCKNVLIDYSKFGKQCFVQLNKIVDINAQRLGYGFRKDNDGNECLYSKNPQAEAMAILSPETISDKIYDYLMIREGGVSEKRNCLKSLADDVEVICDKYNGDQKLKKIKQIMQCVRHPKEQMILKYPFFFEHEEKWLDNLFKMFLYSFSFGDSSEVIQKFKGEEQLLNKKI